MSDQILNCILVGELFLAVMLAVVTYVAVRNEILSMEFGDGRESIAPGRADAPARIPKR